MERTLALPRGARPSESCERPGRISARVAHPVPCHGEPPVGTQRRQHRGRGGPSALQAARAAEATPRPPPRGGVARGAGRRHGTRPARPSPGRNLRATKQPL